jgi:anti-sigma factor RsiW
MLSPSDLELLTAYVDGELSARQRKAVEQLLERSAEARALATELAEDARRLRSLSRPSLPADFAERLLEQARAGPRPVRPLPPASRPVPLWAAAAAAAAILLAVGTASYQFFSTETDDAGPPAPRVIAAGANPVEPAPAPETPRAVAVAPADEPKPINDLPEPERLPAPTTALVEGKAAPVQDQPAPVPETALASPIPKLELFREVEDPRLAVVLKVRELELDKARQRLRDELQQGGAYRIEFGCAETARAFERVQAALRKQGIRLLIDQTAAERLKGRGKTNYVLYTENVTPEELLKALQEINEDDQKAEAKRRGDGEFDLLVLNRMATTDHQELSRLLGVDPTKLQPAKSKAPLGVDIRKPLAERTAEQVVQSLQGNGPARPEPGKPALRGPERLALVLAYNPVRPRPAQSKEVKAFLDSRQELRPGTLQMLVVLRNGRN